MPTLWTHDPYAKFLGTLQITVRRAEQGQGETASLQQVGMEQHHLWGENTAVKLLNRRQKRSSLPNLRTCGIPCKSPTQCVSSSRSLTVHLSLALNIRWGIFMVLVWCAGFKSLDRYIPLYCFLFNPNDVNSGSCKIKAWSSPAGWAAVFPHPFGKRGKISTSPAHCAKKKKTSAEEKDGECGGGGVGASMLGGEIHLLKDKGRDRRGWELGLGGGVGGYRSDKVRVKDSEAVWAASPVRAPPAALPHSIWRRAHRMDGAAHTSLLDLCPLPKVPYLPHSFPCCIPGQLASRRADVSPVRLNLRRPNTVVHSPIKAKPWIRNDRQCLIEVIQARTAWAPCVKQSCHCNSAWWIGCARRAGVSALDFCLWNYFSFFEIHSSQTETGQPVRHKPRYQIYISPVSCLTLEALSFYSSTELLKVKSVWLERSLFGWHLEMKQYTQLTF